MVVMIVMTALLAGFCFTQPHRPENRQGPVPAASAMSAPADRAAAVRR
jgi:hypothetical protein